jgi:SAM-dependent methyltransferase
MALSPLLRLRRLSRALLARRYAKARGIPGFVFDGFGRRAGFRLLMARERLGWTYLLNPVSIVRYWEFSFAAHELPGELHRAADISSPRLFSFWAASRYPELRIDLLNPDEDDTAASRAMASALGAMRVEPATRGVHELSREATYDAIWSLSVVEHIGGTYSDTDAIRMMYEALRPGGHLVLTTPVDRAHRDEYRSTDPYGTQGEGEDGGYFFQRVYDERSIEERLIAPAVELGAGLVSLRWFGERQAGHFLAYEQDWLEYGLGRTVDDPREIADHYREYPSWSEMPGIGVCGIHLVRTP